ncbi:MAG: hypothetical protein KDA53_15785 [Hyphomonas sp.]|nr:hypothetical protein [Hyphomonas sp.]
MQRIHTLCAAFVLAAVAACATTPAVPAVPFAERFAAAQAAGNPYAMDAALTQLLADSSLDTYARAETLHARGTLRRLDGDNRPGSVADFEEMLALAPDHPKAEDARAQLDMVKADAEALQARLAYMLTLQQWFDTSWALGERDAPAERYRASGLSPNEETARRLSEAGYLCGEEGEGPPAQGVGDAREWLEGLTWCSAPEPAPETATAEG